MPVNSTGRKYLTDFLKGVSTFHEDTATRFNFDTVDVGGTLTVDNIGVPMIWVNGNSQFEVFIAQDIATAIATGGSPLKDGSVIGFTVGQAAGVGFNKADTDLSVADTQMTLLYRGDASVVNDGIEWGTAAAPAQALFLAQMEAQRVTTIDNAEVVTPAYTS